MEMLHEVFDLTEPSSNIVFNATVEEAKARLSAGDETGIRQLAGHFALVARQGTTVRMARSLSIPMRYFIVKRVDGPALVVAHRIDTIARWLDEHGYGDQFHPSYTRMVPAHYITELRLIGCPDPNPTYRRFLRPQRERLAADVQSIGEAYIGALYDGVRSLLRWLPADAPIGVLFSGGIDSGSVFLTTYRAILDLGMNPARLKAFSLSVGEDGPDLCQARAFLDRLDLGLYLEPIVVEQGDLDWRRTVGVVEDYKPLDVQAATVGLALLEGIRSRYPDWCYLLDGDGGDENLKDYPIEANPELTIRSVFNNLMLYHEGWGVDAIKHSLTYTGGLSRGCTRTFAPASKLGFRGFSPLTLSSVIDVAEGIPFVALTQWSHEALYALKGQVVAAGVSAVTGFDMPVFEKRRFQDGVSDAPSLPSEEAPYRKAFNELFVP